MRLGLGIGADRLTAASSGSSEVWTRPLEPWSGGTWTDLGDALEEFKAVLSSRAKRGIFSREGSGLAEKIPRFARDDRRGVSVALLPPLVEVKRLRFPPLRSQELERVLTRDAARYFLQAHGPMVVGVSRLPAGRRVGGGVIAAAASAALVEETHRQVQRAGWAVDRIVPAYAAWARMLATVAGREGDEGWVVVGGEASVDLLECTAGQVAAVRRLPSLDRAAEAEAREEIGAIVCARAELRGRPVMVLGAGGCRDRLVAEPEAGGASALPAGDTPCGGDPHACAAAFASRTTAPELVPEAVARTQALRARSIARALVAASIVLIATAAGLEWTGLQRELTRVTQRREQIAGRVAEAMAARTAGSELLSILAALDTAEQGFHRWPAALGQLAVALPRDAHLLAFHADADSLRVEGLADRASGVMDALGRAPIIGALRADAPIRQETSDSAPPVEHFLLSARLAAGGASPEPGGER